MNIFEFLNSIEWKRYQGCEACPSCEMPKSQRKHYPSCELVRLRNSYCKHGNSWSSDCFECEEIGRKEEYK